jgi:hypothetical protein
LEAQLKTSPASTTQEEQKQQDHHMHHLHPLLQLPKIIMEIETCLSKEVVAVQEQSMVEDTKAATTREDKEL